MLKKLRSLFRPLHNEKRSFSAAASSRLTADWIVAPLSADAAIDGNLSILRNRVRDLERNNEWARGFLRTAENNVIGSTGITLQMRVKDASSKKLDEIANDKIETAFYQAGRVKKLTVCKRHSWISLTKLMVRRLLADGEVLVRFVPRREGLKLQILEADMLDEQSWTEPNGNMVRMGVELDADRAPVAYHLLGTHPGEVASINTGRRQRVRVPADQICHLFFIERPDQNRGVPSLVASMKGLKMLDGYAEAELVAARTGAAKMGFFEKSTPDGWTGEIDDSGNLSMDASPGTIEELPAGVTFKEWSNDHPNSGYGDFVKSRLRGVATSLGISYNTLASDLENVNYSSIRAGLLEEREVWKAIQGYLIENFCEPFFEKWLEIELLSGRLGLPFEKMWKFNVPEFLGRRWPWVDPKKDMEANILGIRSGQTSLRKVIAEAGGDIYDVFNSQKADAELAASLGITFPELTDAPKAPAVPVSIDNPE